MIKNSNSSHCEAPQTSESLPGTPVFTIPPCGFSVSDNNARARTANGREFTRMSPPSAATKGGLISQVTSDGGAIGLGWSVPSASSSNKRGAPRLFETMGGRVRSGANGPELRYALVSRPRTKTRPQVSRSCWTARCPGRPSVPSASTLNERHEMSSSKTGLASPSAVAFASALRPAN